MKVTCQYSGVRFEVPHFGGNFTEAIHPIFYFPPAKLEKLAASLIYSGKKAGTDEEYHLLACACAKELEALGYMKFNATIEFSSAASNEFAASFISSFFQLRATLESFKDRVAVPMFSIRGYMEDGNSSGAKGFNHARIWSALSSFMKETIVPWINEGTRSIKQAAFIKAQESVRTSMFSADRRFAQLANDEIDTRTKFVKSFLRKFGKLPANASMTSPITGKATDLATYWLSFFDIGDDVLFLLPAEDIDDFLNHVIETCELGLPVIQFALDYLNDVKKRQKIAGESLAFLAAFDSADDSTMYSIVEDGAGHVPAAQPVVQVKKRETAAEMLARLKGNNNA